MSIPNCLSHCLYPEWYPSLRVLSNCCFSQSNRFDATCFRFRQHTIQAVCCTQSRPNRHTRGHQSPFEQGECDYTHSSGQRKDFFRLIVKNRKFPLFCQNTTRSAAKIDPPCSSPTIMIADSIDFSPTNPAAAGCLPPSEWTPINASAAATPEASTPSFPKSTAGSKPVRERPSLLRWNWLRRGMRRFQRATNRPRPHRRRPPNRPPGSQRRPPRRTTPQPNSASRPGRIRLNPWGFRWYPRPRSRPGPSAWHRRR